MVQCESICKNIKEILIKNKKIVSKVDSIFNNVVNLQTDFGLVTCTKKKEVLVPNGVLLNKEFNPCNYELGQTVYLSDSYTDDETNIFVNLDYVNLIDLHLYKNDKIINIDKLKIKIKLFLKKNNLDFCIGEILCNIKDLNLEEMNRNYSIDIIDNVLPLFKEFIEKIKNNKSLCDYENILGFGVGLTPSSDDFVLGMLSVFCFFNNSRYNILNKYIKNYVNTTTKISSNMLKNALDDNYPSHIINFYNQISVNLEHIENVLEVFLSHGHSSGIDALYGIYVGLYCIL